MSTDHALILDGVFYRVSGVDILQGVYLKLEAGTICGLFGRNGSGKTTALKVAAGQIQPSGGITIIDGERVHKPSKWRRFAKLAYLPQESMLPPDIKVRSVLRGVGLAPDKVMDLLKPLVDQQVEELSGGERRLLEVEIVLSLGRKYVLLDEPFTGVEPLLIDKMSQRIRTAASEGAGILVSDHYHQYVAPLVDDAYLMWQKQCYRLEREESIEQQLKRIGYLGSKPSPSA